MGILQHIKENQDTRKPDVPPGWMTVETVRLKRTDNMISKTDIVYISGPMNGIEDYNLTEFIRAENLLHYKYGCAIHNPAKAFGGRQDLERKIYMRHDIQMLLEATAIVFLSGWTASPGAQFEYTISKELDLRIYYLEEIETPKL